MSITTILSQVGIILTIVGSVFAFAKSIGKLTNRVDHLEKQQEIDKRENDKTENITYENGRQISGIQAILTQIIERLDRIENKLDARR